MRKRFVLSPEAGLDLVQIWRYIRKNAGIAIADKVESVILNKIRYIAGNPGGGHWRKDLTDQPVKFFPVYSYLIVYLPDTQPLGIIAILHAHRDVAQSLRNRPPLD